MMVVIRKVQKELHLGNRKKKKKSKSTQHVKHHHLCCPTLQKIDFSLKFIEGNFLIQDLPHVE